MFETLNSFIRFTVYIYNIFNPMISEKIAPMLMLTFVRLKKVGYIYTVYCTVLYVVRQGPYSNPHKMFKLRKKENLRNLTSIERGKDVVLMAGYYFHA
jgi:hypothetical protein